MNAADELQEALGLVGGFNSWVHNCTRKDQSVCTPLRSCLESYLAHVKRWGFPVATGGEFLALMQVEPDVRVRMGGRGRLRYMADGIMPEKET